MSGEENFQTNAGDVIESLPEEQSTENNEEVEGAEGAGMSADAEEGPGDIQEALKDVLDGAEASEADSEEPQEESEEDVEDKIKELKKKLKLKVDGEEFEEEIDFNDEDRLKRALQKEKAFDKRSQEMAQLKGQINDFVKALRENPGDVLRDMGHDLDELAYNHLQRQVEEAKKSPEQLAQEKMEKELADLKAEKEKLAKDREEAELEKLRNEHATKIENDINSALGKADTVLPKDSPWVLRKVAETMLFASQNGFPEVSAEQVIPYVEKQFMSDLQKMFDVFPEDVIEKVVKKQNLDRVRKRRVNKRKQDISTKTAKQVVKATNNKAPDSSEPKSKKTYKDLFDPRF